MLLNPRLARSAVVALTLAATLVAVGCSSPRGRLDTQETTKGEKSDPAVLMTALLEFADQVPERLIQDLYEDPDITAIEGKATILIGDFQNKTVIVPTTDFEMVAQRIRNRLINSKVASSKLKFYEKRRRVERLADGEKVLNTDGSSVDAPAYDAKHTLLLLGDFYRTPRANTNLYYMQFQLVRASDNEILFSDSYEVKQAY